mmetsp:Transcript_13249/g.25384  ORF Transcript_13249/g.25384 Transcript_13249/m.25384 type:complete len:235 (-) Transcript_13249:621-1325(-)
MVAVASLSRLDPVRLHSLHVLIRKSLLALLLLALAVRVRLLRVVALFHAFQVRPARAQLEYGPRPHLHQRLRSAFVLQRLLWELVQKHDNLAKAGLLELLAAIEHFNVDGQLLEKPQQGGADVDVGDGSVAERLQPQFEDVEQARLEQVLVQVRLLQNLLHLRQHLQFVDGGARHLVGFHVLIRRQLHLPQERLHERLGLGVGDVALAAAVCLVLEHLVKLVRLAILHGLGRVN